MRRVMELVVLMAAAAAGMACGQEQAPAAGEGPVATLTLKARVVSVAALVKNRQGQPVGGLAKEDFELKEDGKPEDIRYFSQGDDLPLTLTLMVDTSGSQRTFIADETAAAMIFFRSMLTRPADRAALVQFDVNVLELQPMTGSVENLQRGLNYLSYPHASLFPKGQQGTLLYDAIVAASGKVLSGQRGRRAMVLLTDGGDNGSRSTLEQAIAAAQKSDIMVFSVYYSADQGFGVLPRAGEGRKVLEKLSAATGGRVFDVNRELTLRQIFAEIAEDLRLEYQLGFTPPAEDAGTYHRIEVKMREHGLSVLARKGYFSAP